MVMRTAINVRSGVALLLALACVALAQGPTRIVVLPFSESATLPGLGLGLATGLQRSLNTIDGLYVPAVGDAALFVRRALGRRTRPGRVHCEDIRGRGLDQRSRRGSWTRVCRHR